MPLSCCSIMGVGRAVPEGGSAEPRVNSVGDPSVPFLSAACDCIFPGCSASPTPHGTLQS